LALLAGLGLAMGLAPAARHVPWFIEKKLARVFGALPDAVPCGGDPALFQTIVKRIYPLDPEDNSFPLTVSLIRGSTVNAFATLGGQVYVYDGLLQQAESAEELAGVLAHEIEHVRRRHIIQGVFVQLFANFGAGFASELVNMRFSRDQEAEADEGGLRRLRTAKVDNAGYQHFFERLARLSNLPAILSDHPSNQQRGVLAARNPTIGAIPVLSPADWQRLQQGCR
jgi:predicted Zn-dependent protease